MIDDERLAAAAREFGTPLYVYDLDAVADRVRALRAALPDRIAIAFAIKANPSLAVLHRLAALGLGADCASAGELEACRRAGVAMERVVFTGPGKRIEDLELAVANGVRAVTVESIGELRRLRRVAEASGRRPGVLLRASGTPRADNVIGAGDGRFGMRWVDLLEAAHEASQADDIELLGLHRFDASNVLEADELVSHARATVTLAARLAGSVDASLGLIDVGGGLGIPYRDGEPELDIAALSRGLAALLRDVDRDPRLRGAELLVEPGRYLVGPAGAYVATVVDVKQSDHGLVATIDGGIHHLLRPALVGGTHRLRLVGNGLARRRTVPVTVGGPLCTALDVIARQRLLPEPAVGDLVVVSDAGAYGFTESMPLFLSHATPAEVVLEGRSMRVARPRIHSSTFLAMQEP